MMSIFVYACGNAASLSSGHHMPSFITTNLPVAVWKTT